MATFINHYYSIFECYGITCFNVHIWFTQSVAAVMEERHCDMNSVSKASNSGPCTRLGGCLQHGIKVILCEQCEHCSYQSLQPHFPICQKHMVIISCVAREWRLPPSLIQVVCLLIEPKRNIKKTHGPRPWGTCTVCSEPYSRTPS
jgi:hypothetical protein